MVRVFITRTAREALAALDYLRADAVLDALGELERAPYLGHQLRGRLTGLQSYRVGVYRIIHELRDDRTVRVVAIRHRGTRLRDGPPVTPATVRYARGRLVEDMAHRS